MHVFLRRAGKVIGSFDRLDYLAQLDQGGITPDDEWTPVGEETWRSVGDEAPFLRSNERRRLARVQVEREIAKGCDITMWSWRMIARKGPNTGSGRYSLVADTKSADKVRIWYQAGLVTA